MSRKGAGTPELVDARVPRSTGIVHAGVDRELVAESTAAARRILAN